MMWPCLHAECFLEEVEFPGALVNWKHPSIIGSQMHNCFWYLATYTIHYRQDFGVYLPTDGLIGSPPSMDFFHGAKSMNGSSAAHSTTFAAQRGGGGGMSDVFGPMPPSPNFLTSSGIGMGPGVISLDAFGSGGGGYSTNMGRPQRGNMQNQGLYC